MATAGWTGSPGRDTAAWYRGFATREVGGASPTYARLCFGVAADAAVLTLLDTLPEPKRQPNLLLAAVRFHGGPIDSYEQFRGWLLAHTDQVCSTMLARRTQTNEPRRCATWLPALPGPAAAPAAPAPPERASPPRRPIALLEVGASAGLCLYPDRYSYRYTTPAGERSLGRSTVLLECAVHGAAPVPEQLPAVVWRAGLDLDPLDVTRDDDVRWLESLIWPEEKDRFPRLHAAVAIARREPPRIVRGDLVTDLAAVAAAAPGDAVLVVVHSAVLAYVDADGRRAFAAAVRELAAHREVCWLSNEAPGIVERTDVPTGGRSLFVLARDGVPLALTGPHGHFVEWLR